MLDFGALLFVLVFLGLHILFVVLNLTGLTKKIAKNLTKAKREVKQENKHKSKKIPLFNKKCKVVEKKKKK